MGETRYAYNALSYLTEARYADGTEELRQADAVVNFFRTRARTDRRYGRGGQLHEANGTRYRYDEEGVKALSEPDGQTWRYAWDGAGQLQSVQRPDGYRVTFSYDALGRRVSKRFRGRVTKWVWDGDKPLHEWSALELGPGAQELDDLATWLFDEDSFTPAAKLTRQGRYSVVADHLGTPLALYDARGRKTWQAQLDSYGAVREGKGRPHDCPFRYQGQYEDVETGLYYNRFRYYDPEAGSYISQDLIGLRGGQRLYSYVANPAAWVDALGLSGTPVIVIGEGQKAVDETTRVLKAQGHNVESMMVPKNQWKGGRLYDGMPQAEFDKSVEWNKQWLADKIDQGYKIVDIGEDPTRVKRSPFYKAEQEAISEKGVARIRLKKLPNGESIAEMRARIGC